MIGSIENWAFYHNFFSSLLGTRIWSIQGNYCAAMENDKQCYVSFLKWPQVNTGWTLNFLEIFTKKSSNKKFNIKKSSIKKSSIKKASIKKSSIKKSRIKKSSIEKSIIKMSSIEKSSIKKSSIENRVLKCWVSKSRVSKSWNLKVENQ